ncbi:MAG TPA: ribosome maturation factor RimM [Cyclobacteriaceae bacterium]|jgi:16S rRNA processing protein RimM|nr:ribosome maturation factor RimM [Cyclobacteriaceae bacterium]
MTFEDCFKIGYVSKTHGLKGEVTAVIEIEAVLEDATSLFLDLKGTLVPHFIEKISGTTNKPFIKFEGIQSLEQASSLKGCSIYMLKSARAKLKRGEFYDDEIVGFEVKDKNLGLLGEVKEIQSQGPNKLLSIIHKGKETLIPIQGPFITSINKSKKLIFVELPEGFLDI